MQESWQDNNKQVRTKRAALTNSPTLTISGGLMWTILYVENASLVDWHHCGDKRFRYPVPVERSPNLGMGNTIKTGWAHSRNKIYNDVVWRSKISSKHQMMNSGANAECFTTCRVNLCSDGTEGLPSGPTVNVFLTFGNSFFLQALPTILLLVTWLYFRKCTVIHVETKV